MIVTSSLGVDHLLMPLAPCQRCGSERPAVVCTTHRICQACGQLQIEPQEVFS